MKNNTINIIAALTTATILSSCGMYSTKEKGDKAEQNNISLMGEWKNGCTQRSWFTATAFEQQVRKFSALGDFERQTVVYSDANCATSDFSIQEHGTYDDLGTSAAVQGARDINFTITAASITPQSDAAVTSLNQSSYCGMNTWQKDQATDVLGKDCIGANHPKGEVVFDIYRLDNDGKRLTTGKSSLFLDRGDAQSRPATLDDAHAFARP